jgi:hypothetical protein
MDITITTALGTSSDTDTQTMGVVGSADLVLSPTDPDWSTVRFDSLQLALSDVTFHFEIYCFPILGCQVLDVALQGLYIESAAPMEAAINPKTRIATFNDAPFRIFGAFAATGVGEGSGPINTEVPASFSCRVQDGGNHDVFVDQLSLSPIANAFDPATLPSGVTALSFIFSTDLSGVTLRGEWVGDFPYDLDGNGAVDAADLAQLLSQWGGPGSADFDGDGTVGASDLAQLLGNWTS